MHFLFVGPNVCRQLLSDSQSPTTPLLLANTPYCKAYSGLSPYSAYPCLTHIIKDGNNLRPLLLINHYTYLIWPVIGGISSITLFEFLLRSLFLSGPSYAGVGHP